MADPKTKDEDQNKIPPETDWPKPNIWPPRQWSVGLKQLISNFLYVVITISVLILVPTIIFGCFYLLRDIISLYTKTDDPDQLTKLRNSLFILAALIGAPFLVWRTMLAAEQTKTAEKQANTAQEKSYTELFTQAIEQLGSVKPVGKDQYEENIEVRVGALYALERIMHDSDKDAKTIIDTLCTYVKHNCGKPISFDFKLPNESGFETISNWFEAIKKTFEEMQKRADSFKEKAPANREDIQTALKIIGNRPPKNKTKENMPDLSGVNFQGAKLKQFDLSYCNLTEAHMQGANLYSADMQWAILRRAKMQGAEMVGTKFQHAEMHESEIQGASMQNVNLQNTTLEDANMQRVDLRGAQLQWANFEFSQMQGAKLHTANMYQTNFTCVHMQGVDMEGATLHRTNLESTALSMAQLSRVKMYKTRINSAFMFGVNLYQAEIDKVYITGALKQGASVLEVDLTKTKFDFEILQAQLPDMFGHKTLTILPEGMKVPDHWSEAEVGTEAGRQQYMREWEAFKKEKGLE